MTTQAVRDAGPKGFTGPGPRKAPPKDCLVGLWGVNGDEHRRLMLPAFHRRRISVYRDDLVKEDLVSPASFVGRRNPCRRGYFSDFGPGPSIRRKSPSATVLSPDVGARHGGFTCS